MNKFYDDIHDGFHKKPSDIGGPAVCLALGDLSTWVVAEHAQEQADSLSTIAAAGLERPVVVDFDGFGAFTPPKSVRRMAPERAEHLAIALKDGEKLFREAEEPTAGLNGIVKNIPTIDAASAIDAALRAFDAVGEDMTPTHSHCHFRGEVSHFAFLLGRLTDEEAADLMDRLQEEARHGEGLDHPYDDEAAKQGA